MGQDYSTLTQIFLSFASSSTDVYTYTPTISVQLCLFISMLLIVPFGAHVLSERSSFFLATTYSYYLILVIASVWFPFHFPLAWFVCNFVQFYYIQGVGDLRDGFNRAAVLRETMVPLFHWYDFFCFAFAER